MKLATLCYVQDGDRTLMLHRVKKKDDVHAGKWNGLGGKVQDGETPEECAIREIFEESGLRARNPKLQGFLTFPLFRKGEDWYAFVYCVTEFEGDLIESPEGDLSWIPNDQILSLNLWEGDRIFLPWLNSGRYFSGKFEYVDGQLQDHMVVFHDFPFSLTKLS